MIAPMLDGERLPMASPTAAVFEWQDVSNFECGRTVSPIWASPCFSNILDPVALRARARGDGSPPRRGDTHDFARGGAHHPGETL